MAVLIEILCGMLSQMGPENHVLDEGAHWRCLANMIESSVCN